MVNAKNVGAVHTGNLMKNKIDKKDSNISLEK